MDDCQYFQLHEVDCSTGPGRGQTTQARRTELVSVASSGSGCRWSKRTSLWFCGSERHHVDKIRGTTKRWSLWAFRSEPQRHTWGTHELLPRRTATATGTA